MVFGDTSHEREILDNGALKETSVTHGLTLGFERYRGENFGQIGWVRRSKVRVTNPDSDYGPRRESSQNLYLGLVGSNGDGAFNIASGEQGYVSLLMYLDRDDVFHLKRRFHNKH